MHLKFNDYPDFKPNLTPFEIFNLGSFGGTYFRPIYSSITGENYSNIHKNYEMLNDVLIIVDLLTTNKRKHHVRNNRRIRFKN